MVNRYGLDISYFKKNLERLIRDIDNYTPDEMSRALKLLANVASSENWDCKNHGTGPLTGDY